MTTLTPNQLRELCQSGRTGIDLIDVRTPVEFREVHLDIARNVPLDQLNPAQVMQGRGDKPLYVICRSGSRGKQACEQFHKAGFTNVINIEGGTARLRRCRAPGDSRKKAISLERQVRIAAVLLVLTGVGLGFYHPDSSDWRGSWEPVWCSRESPTLAAWE